MSVTTGAVRGLDVDECRALLRRGDLGRLATVAAGYVDIFPVNYVSDGDSILIHTSPGTKLMALTINDAVAFEIDGHDAGQAWSVVAHGRAHQLERMVDIDDAEASAVRTWMPTPKDRFVRIAIERLSGVWFERAREDAPRREHADV